jgi:hypothetical protein
MKTVNISLTKLKIIHLTCLQNSNVEKMIDDLQISKYENDPQPYDYYKMVNLESFLKKFKDVAKTKIILLASLYAKNGIFQKTLPIYLLCLIKGKTNPATLVRDITLSDSIYISSREMNGDFTPDLDESLVKILPETFHDKDIGNFIKLMTYNILYNYYHPQLVSSMLAELQGLEYGYYTI